MMIAVIGDIIGSRKIVDRLCTQEILRASLDRVNYKYPQSLASNFSITLGDEIQGVLRCSKGLLRILDDIAISLRPEKIRFGIGIGFLSTSIDPASSIGADGPAYWKAREAIEFVHKYNDYGRANVHLLAVDYHESIGLINEILKLTAFQMSGWRDSQMDVFRYILYEDIFDPESINHTEMAGRMGILPSSLTRRFESSGIKRYMSSRNEVELEIERVNKHYD